MKSRSLLFTILMMIAGVLPGQIPAKDIPAFSFYRIDNTLFTTKDLRPGRLQFFGFFDTDCEHCQKALAMLTRYYKEYKRTDIYLITLDGKDKTLRFEERYGPGLKGKKNVTILLDLRNEFLPRFSPRKFPAMYLYSPQGKLLDYEDSEESMFRFLKEMSI